SPVLPIRGMMPWHKHWSSAIAWNAADYRAYIDQLVKMRFNLVAFHTYDNQPYGAYEHDGALAAGDPLPNTSETTAGSEPLATGHFMAGAGRYFASDYFGAEAS